MLGLLLSLSMPVLVRCLRIPFPLIGAIALFLAGGIGASPAQAACGDYVMVIGHASAHDFPAKPSCHGPGCSKAPVQTESKAPHSIQERPSSPAAVLAGSVSPMTVARRRAASETSGDTVRHPLSIFHPPRPC